MSTIILSSIFGQAGSIFGPIGRIIGSELGTLLGAESRKIKQNLGRYNIT